MRDLVFREQGARKFRPARPRGRGRKSWSCMTVKFSHSREPSISSSCRRGGVSHSQKQRRIFLSLEPPQLTTRRVTWHIACVYVRQQTLLMKKNSLLSLVLLAVLASGVSAAAQSAVVTLPTY